MKGVNNLAFPDIKTDRPVGTQMVSTIDDFERETRTWLKQCMETISGYSDGIQTVGVLGWTSSTRPTQNDTNNYLLGYNTETSQLEIIGVDGTNISILSEDTKKSLALLSHPVGTYIWTSDTNFNPNTAWGGTWERIQDGRCLISDCTAKTYITAKTLGGTGGTETVTLNLNQIPQHSHPHVHRHRHDRGDMNITGTFGGAISGSNWSGAFYKNREIPRMNDADGHHWETGFDAKRSWSGHTSYDETSASAHAQGGGQEHNNMPPYRVAACWHRTA